MLSRVATVNRQHPEGLIHLIEVLRNHEAPNFVGGGQVALQTPSNLHVAPVNATREFDDSQGMLTNIITVILLIMYDYYCDYYYQGW